MLHTKQAAPCSSSSFSSYAAGLKINLAAAAAVKSCSSSQLPSTLIRWKSRSSQVFYGHDEPGRRKLKLLLIISSLACLLTYLLTYLLLLPISASFGTSLACLACSLRRHKKPDINVLLFCASILPGRTTNSSFWENEE